MWWQFKARLKKLRIAGADITVKYKSFSDQRFSHVDDADGSDRLDRLDGLWIARTDEIWINTDRSKSVQQSTLIHEAVHAVDSYLTEGSDKGLLLNEEQVCRLTQIIMAMIEDNRQTIQPIPKKK